MSYLDIFVDLMNLQCEGDVIDPNSNDTERFPWNTDRLNGNDDYCYNTDYKYKLCSKCEANLKFFAIIKLQNNKIKSLKQDVKVLKEEVDDLRSR